MENNGNYQELGALLKAEREKRNFDINEAADQLKINSRLLKALEAGDLQALPHPAYAKGFLRSYASWLGLGQEDIQNALNQKAIPDSLKKEYPASPKKDHRQSSSDLQLPDMEEKKPRKSHKGLYFFIFLCIIGACGYYAWKEGHLDFLKIERNSKADMTSTIPSADAYMADLDASEKAVPKESVPPASQTDADKFLPIGSRPAPEIRDLPNAVVENVSPVPVDTSVSSPSLDQNGDSATDETQEQPAVQENSGQHKLIITAIEECWIHSNADKTDTRQFSLRKGDTFALTFADSLELKLGNAGGVRLRYDGSDLPPPGSSGQVRTISFPPKEN